MKNPLGDLAGAAHQWLFQNHGIEGSYAEKGKRGFWRDDPDEPFTHLISFAKDTPETDSAFKQLAHHVGQLANQWGVLVTKEGKGGPEPWLVTNKNYVPGQPADPTALAYPESAKYVQQGPESHPAPQSLISNTILENHMELATQVVRMV